MHEAGAAVVAAQLLAFYREPVRYRPRLTHGREPFPGGIFALRFAQAKFPHNIQRDLPASDRGRLREAAEFFIRQVCLWEGATHYQVLCVAPDARRDAIKEHYHALMALLHPDRAEALHHWPPDAAQRVNAAYDTLSHEERRREYDASLRKAPGPASLDEVLAHPPRTAAVHAPLRSRGAAGIRLRRPMLVVSAAIASLFFLHVWLAAEVPAQYSALQSATPFELSSRWMRDALGSDRRPRFLGGASSAPASERDPVPVLAPLWRAISNASVRMAGPEPTPLQEPPAVLAARTPEPVRTDDAAPRVAPPRRAEAATPAPTPAPAPQVAQAPAQSAQRPAQLAQAQPSIPAEQIETLVALLITYYEAGDLDRFLALQDAQSIGVWEALRLRHDFEEFFRATRSRRLRLNRMSLEAAGDVARAQGEATLLAEYVDEPRRLERSVRIELEAVPREGGLRISRLTLYPHGG